MKKVFLLVATIVASMALSSYDNANGRVVKTEMGNEYIYYTEITAWREATESDTFYLFYKEGNGERKYTVCDSRNLDECFFSHIIYDNELYHNSECKDYRKNYPYKFRSGGGFTYYFNCKLPYRKEKTYY